MAESNEGDLAEDEGAGWTTLRTAKGFGLYPMVMGSSRRFQAGHIYFLRRSLWNMGGEDKIGGWEMSLEAIAIAPVKNEGLSQGSAGADGEEWVNLRDIQEGHLDKG